MKKIILIISKKDFGKNLKINNEISKFIEKKTEENFIIEQKIDYFNNIQYILDNNILQNKNDINLYYEFINVLINLDKYTYILYVPDDIESIKNIKVYYPQNIDKINMYSYISNANIYLSPIKKFNKEIYSNLSKKELEYTRITNKYFNKIKNIELITPWILLFIISFFDYYKITIIPFIVTFVTFILLKIKDNDDYDLSTFSILLMIYCMIINLIFENWFLIISKYISVLAILFFVLLSYILESEAEKEEL